MKYLKNTGIAMVLFILIFVTIAFISTDESKKPLSIEQAVKQRIVEAKIKSKGGYQGECIEMDIKNLLDRDTIIRIEPGRRLVAEDSSLQDILIIKEIQLFLAAGENKNINIFGFCCQATDRGPEKGADFNVGFMADSGFIFLAEYLSKTNLPLSVMQSAVWVLSNNHTFNSIANDNENDKPRMKELFQLLARIKKIKYEFPWYSLKYKQDTAQLFTNRPVKIFGEFEYMLSDPSNVDLIIKTAQNHLVKNLFVNRPQSPDKYIHPFSFDVANWPKGKYYMILYVDNQQKVKREFEL